MATQDSTIATLADIRIKVRRLTRSPSLTQLSNADIDSYINSFVLYDLPSHIITSTLMQTFTFYTKPNIDVYESDPVDEDSPFFNFINKYIGVYGPSYVAGKKTYFTKSREDFYNRFPLTNALESIGTGNGSTSGYDGTLSTIPILQNNVTFSAVGDDNSPLSIYDVPDDYDSGTLKDANDGTDSGTINYITGEYDIEFTGDVGDGETVQAQTIPYQADLPTTILYNENKFTIRPVPDRPYRVTVEVQGRPTSMLATVALPELARWWEYIAYGAAKKVFEDRMDMESVAMLMPEFRKQRTLANRPTISAQSVERVSTIYINGRNQNGI